MSNYWKKLTNVSKKDLYDVRIMIHQAVQLPAITGRCLNNEDPSDITAALTWLNDKNAFASRFWNGNKHRSVLNISQIKLSIVNKENATVAEFILIKKNFEETLNWLKEQASALGYDKNKITKKLPYQIPHYKYADNQPFQEFNENLLSEFQNLYANANHVLNIVKSEYNSSDVLCWPHHFDIATTITVEENSDSSKSKSISLGMSPGDDSYNQPYFYVYPWPYPEDKNNLPEIPVGSWHTENWFGMVLTLNDITSTKEDQFGIVSKFTTSSINAAKKLL